MTCTCCRAASADDVIGFDGGGAAHVEGVDVGDDARGVVGEFEDRILSRILSGGETEAERSSTTNRSR